MSAIGVLLEPQLPVLRRYARALTRDAGRAEDLVQTCLLRALANQHSWREGTDLRAWLCTILHNVYVSEVRRHVRERDRLRTIDIEPVVIPGSDPELSYCVRELEEALHRLPAYQREIVLQVSLERVVYEDAAIALGIPVGTVRSRLGKARENLRAMTDRPPGRKRNRRHAGAYV